MCCDSHYCPNLSAVGKSKFNLASAFLCDFSAFRERKEAGAMKSKKFLGVLAWSIIHFVPSCIFVYHLSESIVNRYATNNAYKELLSRITAAARPISLSTPSSSPFVILTVGTYSYRDYLTNLACSFQRIGNGNSKNGSYPFQILLLSLDSRLHSYPMPPNVHSVYFNVSTTSEFSGEEPAHRYGQRGFDIVTRQKFAAVRAVLSAGFDVLYTDGDVVWCDPSTAVMDIASQAHPENTSIVTQSAHNSGQVMNTGLFYAISSPNTREFLYSVENLPPKAGNDQTAANNLACKQVYGGEKLSRDHCRWKKGANLRVLEPKSRYLLGATKFEGTEMRRMNTTKLNQLCNSKRIALLHYSYYSLGHKKSGMRKAGFWLYNGETPGRCRKIQ